jgi:Spy/CpxP family protein refolding chaperone
MSIQEVRKSILIATGAGVIAAAGLLAGRLSAGAFSPHARGDFAPRVFARISRALDLTDEQQAKIKGVLQSHSDEIKAQIQASTAARSALHAAVINQPLDESAIRTAAQRVGQTQGDAAILFSKIRAEVDPILTPDQKDRIQKFHDTMGQRADKAVQSFDAFLKGNS